MALYEEIKKIESKQQFSANLSLFNLRDETLNLLGQPAYQKNPLAARRREGEELEAIARRLVKDRTYALKFKEEERERYNQRVQELEQITSHARHLRCHSFFSWNAPEGGALKGGIAAVLLSSCMVASHPGEASELVAGVMSLATIGIYATLGANCVNFKYGHPRCQRPKMWEEIRYIDNILKER